jgi:diguanylate cyclase (GGDEF)-like protein
MLSISAILSYYAMVRLECFDLVPMARSLVFSNMRDAALVTDLRYHLVDFNPTARELLPDIGKMKLGDDVTTALCEPAALQQVFLDPCHPQEIEMKVVGELQYFEVRALPLRVEGKQLGWAILWANITAQACLVSELRRDAQTDELTGVTNRRHFMAAIERENARSIRKQSSFSVMIVDIDHFKSINDRFGHEAGDRVLSAIARRIAPCMRQADILSRYGGDEFIILLPETGQDGAIEAAERVRRVIAGTAVEQDGQNIYVSVSIGLATHGPLHSGDWPQSVKQADRALYRAKAAGRNCIVHWNSPFFPTIQPAISA